MNKNVLCGSQKSHTIHGTGIFTCILVDFYGFHVGKYAVRPMDAMVIFDSKLFISISYWISLGRLQALGVQQ